MFFFLSNLIEISRSIERVFPAYSTENTTINKIINKKIQFGYLNQDNLRNIFSHHYATKDTKMKFFLAIFAIYLITINADGKTHFFYFKNKFLKKINFQIFVHQLVIGLIYLMVKE